jgi:hypothetical protein
MKAELRCVAEVIRTLVVVGLACNVLLASWIFMDRYTVQDRIMTSIILY